MACCPLCHPAPKGGYSGRQWPKHRRAFSLLDSSNPAGELKMRVGRSGRSSSFSAIGQILDFSASSGSPWRLTGFTWKKTAVRPPPNLKELPKYPVTGGTILLALGTTLAGWNGYDLSRLHETVAIRQGGRAKGVGSL